MFKPLKHGVIFIILIAAFIFVFASITESKGDVRVIFVKGNPKITKVTTKEWVDCKVDMAIDNGDRIKTLQGEAVEISFGRDDLNIIKIADNSDVYVRKGAGPYSVELLKGDLLARIKNIPANSTFEVKTPAGISGARGTGWDSSTDGDRATFGAFENSIYTKGVDPLGNPMAGEIIVADGWKSTVEKFEAPSGVERLSEADLDKWNTWKEDLSERVAAQKEEPAKVTSEGPVSGQGTAATALAPTQPPEPPAEPVGTVGDTTRIDQIERAESLDRMGSDIDKIETKTQASTQAEEDTAVKEREEPPPDGTEPPPSAT